MYVATVQFVVSPDHAAALKARVLHQARGKHEAEVHFDVSLANRYSRSLILALVNSCICRCPNYHTDGMRDLLILFAHLVMTLIRLIGLGGARSIVTESLLIQHQLLIVNRSRQRAPNLRTSDRLLMSMFAWLMRPVRLAKSAVIIKPSTILRFHRVLKERKYRLLFSPKRRGRPGPRGPSEEVIAAIVEAKRRNPRWGCPRIAQQLSLTFDVEINKDVTGKGLPTGPPKGRSVLAHFHWPGQR